MKREVYNTSRPENVCISKLPLGASLSYLSDTNPVKKLLTREKNNQNICQGGYEMIDEYCINQFYKYPTPDPNNKNADSCPGTNSW